MAREPLRLVTRGPVGSGTGPRPTFLLAIKHESCNVHLLPMSCSRSRTLVAACLVPLSLHRTPAYTARQRASALLRLSARFS